MSVSDEFGPPPPPPGARPRRSPWPWVLVVVLLVAATGLGAAAVSRVVGAARDIATGDGKRLESKFPRPLLFPGTRTVSLEEPGEYRIYHEHESMIDGRAVDSSPGAGFELTLRFVERGTEVPLRGLGMRSETYSFPHRKAAAIRTFRVDEPGDYSLTASRSGPGGGEFVLAVGRPVLAGLFRGAAPVPGLLALAGISFLAALGLGIYLLVRR